MTRPALLSQMLGFALVMLPATSSLAANYEFLAAPETDLNRVYRLDRATGEIGACQYQSGHHGRNDEHLLKAVAAR